LERGFARRANGSGYVRDASEVVAAIDARHDEIRFLRHQRAHRDLYARCGRGRERIGVEAAGERHTIEKDRIGRGDRMALAALVLRRRDDRNLANRRERLRHRQDARRTHAVVVADEDAERFGRRRLRRECASERGERGQENRKKGRAARSGRGSHARIVALELVRRVRP
jgi:hypothetical protein